jgi:hypothetical protein
MINQLLQELKETWGYETEELNDIREKMEELANSAFWEGYNECSDQRESGDYCMGFTAYGKPEDFE